MFSSLALAAPLASPRPSRGRRPEAHQRPDDHRRTRPGPQADAKLLPGDVLFIAFDIDGLTIDADGDGQVHDGDGGDRRGRQADLQAGPAGADRLRPARAATLPARAFITIGLDQAAGRVHLQDHRHRPEDEGDEHASR